MSNDVLITPASRKIEFKDSSANVDAKIETDASGNLIITNTGGDISIGDTTSDIFVGDGTNNIDIVFEQDGEIRGTSGVTVTLGQSDSNIRMATDLNLNSNDITNAGSITGTSFSDGTISGITFIDEDSFATNSATRVPTQQSIKAYVDAEVAGVVDSAPAALNTLNELAAALGDDASFSTTTSTALGNRLRVDTAAQGLTGTQQANAITNLGITATKAELNFVDGVTSNIQTQLNGKQATGSYLTGNQTITLSGDVSGSGTTSIAVTIADDSHNHVISNVDGLQTALDGKTSLDHIRSLGVTAFTGGTDPNITTAQYISEMEGDGAFDSFSSVFKTTWNYAGNYNLSDAGSFGPTETAGMSHITWTDNSSDSTRGNITVLAIAPTTGGSAGGVYVYNDQGSSYTPGWREIWTSSTDGAGSGLDADLLDGQQGSYYAPASTALTTSTSFGGDVSGTYNAIVVADDSHNHVISNVDGLQTALDAKLASSSYTASDVLTKIKTVDGAGSGLDADTVDGIQGASLLRSDAADTATGSIVFSGATQYFRKNDTTNYTNAPLIVESYGGSSTTIGIGFHISGQLGRYLRMNSSGVLAWEGSTIWHAGNDGSGSGLDADTLDGVQGSSYLRSDATDTFTTLTGTTLTVNGVLSVTEAIDLADNDILRFGSGDDVEFFCNGSHMYTDLNSGIGNWYIRDGTTTRFTFDDAGDFTATGNVTAYSDERLKNNILVIDGALEKVSQLRGVTFNRTDTEEPRRQTGVIAQEVEKVLPEAVITADDEMQTKSVAYGNMVGLLIEAIKELKTEVNDLKKQLKEIK